VENTGGGTPTFARQHRARGGGVVKAVLNLLPIDVKEIGRFLSSRDKIVSRAYIDGLGRTFLAGGAGRAGKVETGRFGNFLGFARKNTSWPKGPLEGSHSDVGPVRSAGKDLTKPIIPAILTEIGRRTSGSPFRKSCYLTADIRGRSKGRSLRAVRGELRPT